MLGVLLLERRKPLRASPRAGQPRSLFCGMGICFECMVRVDGVSGVRACLIKVAAGMVVETGA
jgi:sarcosine oxidase subunit alpha